LDLFVFRGGGPLENRARAGVFCNAAAACCVRLLLYRPMMMINDDV
jgi:hypothetical protein